ncbi:hypothetical protein GLOIN_2v1775971 [Rhizophagus irregularis DAOM 181602=DAOM 197198]|uniref:Uncharacterized protein n=1 Tax=Rhizophagus irregularis (strain DAOM 181602 / DAOM 197198 / MUCL 43194) TaxID=747089 RepID=A0A2P4PY98_RHIID|nr:hypothetical protein GLOIN_2v1775971 [Rhizophagus irregularis DAOM 181602=DAOM 197198]POG70355.1 hypothetical protein GLOIN_2v1775971 [Rhizophagus irregularis DAOM 181602=DAOM 197198]|eukprot:XP_025177221.1 hypothetical protein GLOIN_2v1775971 [Rhizophagus irregularis DAOM 181602=DAOM 197198]
MIFVLELNHIQGNDNNISRAPTQPITLRSTAASVPQNALSIKSLLLPATLHDDFIEKATILANNQHLEFFSDGSLCRPPDNLAPLMGFGWLLSSPPDIAMSFYARITNWANSQATIQTFNALYLYTPRLTDRRLQKLNNCHLCQSIKQIIDTLQLQVTLSKVKAHSNNFYNDQADALTKQGSRNLISDVNHKDLKRQ